MVNKITIILCLFVSTNSISAEENISLSLPAEENISLSIQDEENISLSLQNEENISFSLPAEENISLSLQDEENISLSLAAEENTTISLSAPAPADTPKQTNIIIPISFGLIFLFIAVSIISACHVHRFNKKIEDDRRRESIDMNPEYGKEYYGSENVFKDTNDYYFNDEPMNGQ